MVPRRRDDSAAAGAGADCGRCCSGSSRWGCLGFGGGDDVLLADAATDAGAGQRGDVHAVLVGQLADQGSDVAGLGACAAGASALGAGAAAVQAAGA